MYISNYENQLIMNKVCSRASTQKHLDHIVMIIWTISGGNIFLVIAYLLFQEILSTISDMTISICRILMCLSFFYWLIFHERYRLFLARLFNQYYEVDLIEFFWHDDFLNIYRKYLAIYRLNLSLTPINYSKESYRLFLTWRYLVSELRVYHSIIFIDYFYHDISISLIQMEVWHLSLSYHSILHKC